MSQMERPLPAAIESTLRAVGQHLSPTHENILRAALVPEPREDGLRAVSREDLYEIIHEVREERHVNSAADDLTGVAWASLRAATPGDGLDAEREETVLLRALPEDVATDVMETLRTLVAYRQTAHAALATEQGEPTNSMNPHCGCSSEGHDGPCAATPGDRLRESMQRELDSGWAVSEVLRRHGIRANIPVSSDD